jgi:serine/threonine protein kinase
MPSLFISYRRADSPDTVKLLHERLTQRLRGWEIFYDHQSIPQGQEFPELLRAKVTSATAVMVIIGPKWLEILKQRASAAGTDHVREEVRLALESGNIVIPVTVGNANRPIEADLAEFPDLQPLLRRNGRDVRPDPLFDADIARVVDGLNQIGPSEVIGTTLDDKYTLTAEIGTGGMGVVYLAQQKHPMKRTVAVKLIKPGMDSKEVLARFDAERQALAVMDHPNIAKVLDAGMAASGRPYFVMEYVKGVPITQYCDEKKLTPQERLSLFIVVCNAVQHSHQKGIIHRDIKPSNVLVEIVDGKPVPKVIDFGLAKALGQKLTDMTLITELEKRVGTLEYSAPEQAAGRSFDVDTRSDIYSLGVLLYELLTGAPPFTHAELLKIGEEEMRRVIREVEPTTPSKKLSRSGELPAIAAKRHLEPGKLTRLVQGDLDWIVMKCLEKENSRRYETAKMLGEELQRFLEDKPVLAGPPSAGYRIRKLLRRKGPVTAASLVLLVLIVGAVVTGIGFVLAGWGRETDAARRQLAGRDADIEKGPKKKTTESELALGLKIDPPQPGKLTISVPGVTGRKAHRVWILFPLSAENYRKALDEYRNFNGEQLAQEIRKKSTPINMKLEVGPWSEPRWIELAQEGDIFVRPIPLRELDTLREKFPSLWCIRVWEFENGMASPVAIAIQQGPEGKRTITYMVEAELQGWALEPEKAPKK